MNKASQPPRASPPPPPEEEQRTLDNCDVSKPIEELPGYKEFDHKYHPQEWKGLVQTVGDTELNSHKFPTFAGECPKDMTHTLCRVCGWNVIHERENGYTSRLRVEYVRGNKAYWSMNSHWLLRDEPNDCSLGNDYISQKFLRDNGATIPLVEMYRFASPSLNIVEPDRFYFTVMSRAKGKRLWDSWHSFTDKQKQSVAKQLGGYIRQWRQFTSPVIRKADKEESQLDDIIIGICQGMRAPTCRKIGYTESEWLEHLSPELRRGLARIHKIDDEDALEVDQLLQKLKDDFPKGGPYVFTHTDLNLTNIMVDDDAIITAILDWESAGFYPWWVEFWRTSQVGDDFWGSHTELCRMIEDDFHPGYSKEMRVEVFRPLFALQDAWNAAPRAHDQRNVWARPPFCQCSPYGGRFIERHMGNLPDNGHRMLEKDEEERILEVEQGYLDKFLGDLKLPKE